MKFMNVMKGIYYGVLAVATVMYVWWYHKFMKGLTTTDSDEEPE